MMLYSKGDTIELYGERMAIVLDNGISGGELVTKYYGLSIVELFKSHSPLLRWTREDGSYIKEHVWYRVLMGDTTGWVRAYKSNPWSVIWDNHEV